MASFLYEFDELPLALFPGIEAGYINGCAEIEYGRDHWAITSVSIEGYKRLTFAERDAGKSPWVFVAPPAEVGALILHRLNNEWADRVQSAVMDQLEIDRESAAEYRAEARREERAMGF